ncbi:MAG: sulfite exporter TauE/SafE family protein [Bacteroidetes bacterium]|nr:sulfite exporter TauE/SafE family protein [Bacteroidota bacterium]
MFQEFVIVILIGIAGGLMSGLFGVGGGIVLVPLMVFLLHFSQKTAQGTTLAMLALPVALIGAWNYHRQGQVNWQVALLLAVGFVLGVYVSSRMAVHLPERLSLGSWHIDQPLRKLFGLLLLAVAALLLFGKK